MTLPHVSPGDLFAFYGLLRQGASGRPAHIDLEAAGRFEGPCRFRGAMYDLGRYPGIVAGDTLCRAEKWRITDVSVVAALDAFEDVDPADPARSLYQRQRIQILDEFGKPTGESGQVYVYNQTVEGARHIADGDWPLGAGASHAREV